MQYETVLCVSVVIMGNTYCLKQVNPSQNIHQCIQGVHVNAWSGAALRHKIPDATS